MFYLILLNILILFAITFVINNYDKKKKTIISFFNVIIILLFIYFLSIKLNINIENESIKNYFKGSISYSTLNKLSLITLFTLALVLFLGSITKNIIDKYSKCSKPLVLVLMMTSLCLSIFVMLNSYAGNKNIYITEVCGSVDTDYIDYKDNIDSDVAYIKIYNNSKYICNINKFYISTSEDNLYENCLYDIEINPFSEQTIYIDKDIIDLISKKKSYIYLSTKEYKEPICVQEIPSLKDNEYYVVNKDDSNGTIYSYEQEPVVHLIDKPSFSVSGGFYNNDFDVYITSNNDCDIYYTTDSSNPTEESTKYSGEPIHIYDRSDEENVYRNTKNVTIDYLTDFTEPEKVDKCFVLRAVAYDKEGNSSEMETQSYFVNLDKYKNENVISLVSDPDALFGDDGIYVTGKDYDEWYVDNYDYVENMVDDGVDLFDIENSTIVANFRKKTKDSEIIGSLEYFNNGEISINQNIGLKIQGNITRFNSLKRFSVYSRKKYSNSTTFKGNIFNSSNIHSIMLREGDWS